jgi:hypothetical protein
MVSQMAAESNDIIENYSRNIEKQIGEIITRK